jgi:two-component system, NarL family, response regulator DevR
MTFQPERRPRIVIADDHPSVLAAFARMLQPCCDVVASVPNGQEALDAVAALKPDILLVDLMLPDLDGLDVCRRVKQTVPETDVVIVTAFDDDHVEAVAIQDGAAAFVPKHSAAATLERTILRIFAERQRNRPD